MNPGSRILIRILDDGCCIQDPDPGSWIQDPDPGSWIQDPGSCILDPGSWIQAILEIPILDQGSVIQESHNSESAFFDISDVLFCAQESQNSSKSIFGDFRRLVLRAGVP